MQPKALTRGQTQVLYRYLPGSVFPHDDYGLCRVESVSLTAVEVNRDALFDALTDVLSRWHPEFSGKFRDPRDPAKWGSYAIGTPREVRFAPYPLLFACRRCERVIEYRTLAKSGRIRCICGGRLKRLAYVQAHNCGRMEEIFFPKRPCPKCNTKDHLALYDPGRVRQARWKCAKCNVDIQALRKTPCACVYSQFLAQGTVSGERFLRVVPTSDPALYAPHSVAFINFPENGESAMRSSPDALGLMLARAWGLLDERVESAVEKRRRIQKGDAKTEELIEALRKVAPDNELVKEHDRSKSKPYGQDELDEVAGLVNDATLLKQPPLRWLVEHVTLLDKTDLTDARAVAVRLRSRGDERGACDIEAAQKSASDVLGITSLRVINDFPLALCAFGYTRIARDPSRSVINPFPTTEEGQIPLYALASETEALWFQLDPQKVAEWLMDNGLCSGGSRPTTERRAWGWLYRVVPGLRQAVFEPSYPTPAATAVRMLLHTMSHVFLRRIEWSGFASSSIGEYLIPGTLSFILYANRVAETKIGGLTTLFEQRLHPWLWDAVQAGHNCVYDPLCRDEGGSCVGCTHREHNCPTFNHELSRATLYGGITLPEKDSPSIKIRKGYWEWAQSRIPAE